ncbi:MAG: hypothetical protein IPI30_18845 [Saprospiraceae bacterium]|nr:hypothetical protein [Candidatus Vicinibacter affinis]
MRGHQVTSEADFAENLRARRRSGFLVVKPISLDRFQKSSPKNPGKSTAKHSGQTRPGGDFGK